MPLHPFYSFSPLLLLVPSGLHVHSQLPISTALQLAVYQLTNPPNNSSFLLVMLQLHTFCFTFFPHVSMSTYAIVAATALPLLLSPLALSAHYVIPLRQLQFSSTVQPPIIIATQKSHMKPY